MTWRVAACLLQLRAQIDLMAPMRSKANDGTIGDFSHAARESDHNPWVRDRGVGVVTAIDITDDPDDGCNAAALVAALIASRDSRIKYLIWNRQIISSNVSPWSWRQYSGRNPHTKHFHLSVHADKGLFDSTIPWSL